LCVAIFFFTRTPGSSWLTVPASRATSRSSPARCRDGLGSPLDRLRDQSLVLVLVVDRVRRFHWTDHHATGQRIRPVTIHLCAARQLYTRATSVKHRRMGIVGMVGITGNGVAVL
jgi:hypothetical protein